MAAIGKEHNVAIIANLKYGLINGYINLNSSFIMLDSIFLLMHSKNKEVF